jgi:hypothetical protein
MCRGIAGINKDWCDKEAFVTRRDLNDSERFF